MKHSSAILTGPMANTRCKTAAEQPPRFGHAILRSITESYLIIAVTLLELGPAPVTDRRKFIARLMAQGEQMLLRRTVSCESSVSQDLLATGLRLAEHLNCWAALPSWSAARGLRPAHCHCPVGDQPVAAFLRRRLVLEIVRGQDIQPAGAMIDKPRIHTSLVVCAMTGPVPDMGQPCSKLTQRWTRGHYPRLSPVAAPGYNSLSCLTQPFRSEHRNAHDRSGHHPGRSTILPGLAREIKPRP